MTSDDFIYLEPHQFPPEFTVAFDEMRTSTDNVYFNKIKRNITALIDLGYQCTYIHMPSYYATTVMKFKKTETPTKPEPAIDPMCWD